MKNNKKGFTLIELIIVTVILGILAAVAVPRYMGTVNRSEASGFEKGVYVFFVQLWEINALKDIENPKSMSASTKPT